MADNSEQNLPPGPGTDNTLQIAVLGHLLKAEREQTANTLDTMATLLQAAVPDRVEVTLSGYFWQKVRPIATLTITFDDGHYHIERKKSGAPKVTKRKVVRDIVLKSSEISMEDCITEVVTTLSEIEKRALQRESP